MLEVKNLKTVFRVGDKTVHAVDDVSFEIKEQQVVGLVGESGSGKSVTSTSILNLLPPNGEITSGSVNFKGQDLLSLSKKEMRKIRGNEIGLIFQNPLAALNPVFTIGNQMIETIQLHHKVSKLEAEKEAVSLLKKVNIPDAETRLNDYPHQFSLGMCQRIMIALTLSMNPSLLIADEPTASLDVTIQAQILSLLHDLKKEFKMSIFLISHDLGVIAQSCDYILVMYLGRIVEKGTPHQIFKNPQHPYTQALISSIPVPDPDHNTAATLLKGDIPSPMNLPSGCRFHPRCPKAFSDCSAINPSLIKTNDSDVACLLYKDD
ncbi:peptide ABC transporter ATP-binding protein [Candidatus Marinamargulisbacteria bacterium SCGC AG-410-N11]|nr:peptide ABC transporter ATP-binding protein [Candidatus Marinamargulisbacteria bacterium SCGC AG-410-N11]